jgi:hypothetical protein
VVRNIKIEFAGISIYMEKVDLDEHFEEYYDGDDRVVYFSKKTFRHEEEGYLDFSYKYAIVVTDVGAYTGEDDAPIVVELMLVPSFNDLTKENKKGLIESGGYGNEISEEGL